MLDLGILEKDSKEKIIVFAEIRNRFAHNATCTTFQMAYTSEIKNKLLKFYKNFIKTDPGSIDEDFQLFNFLSDDVKNILIGVRDQIYGRKTNLELLQIVAAIGHQTILAIQENPRYYDRTILHELTDQIQASIFEKIGHEKGQKFKADVKINWGKAFS